MQLAALAAADLGRKRAVGMKLKAAVKVLLTKRRLERGSWLARVPGAERRYTTMAADAYPGHHLGGGRGLGLGTLLP